MRKSMRRGSRSAGSRGDTPNLAKRGLAVVGIGAAQFGAALVAAWSVGAAVAATAGIGLVVAAVLWPALLLAAVFPASFATWRVGPGALGMSIADVFTILGVIAAFPYVPWRSKTFRRVLFAALGYSAVVSVAVVANYSTSGAVEVVHRFVMVVGTVCIGAAVIRTGKVTLALRGLMIMAVVVSVSAIIFTLTHDLDPAYAFGMQKNTAGTLLVSTILVLFFAERYLRWPRTLTMPVGLVLLCGLAATQSRGAGAALVAVFVVYLIRTTWKRQGRRLAKVLPLILVLGVALSAVMITSFQNEAKEHQGSAEKFGSVGSRQITNDIAWNEIIKPNPVLGIGPKWFNDPYAPGGEPHNLVLGELASDGFVGLAAFIVLMWTCLRATRATRSVFGPLAFYVLVARLVADMFDIFWVAGPNTLPFLILGLAVGAASLEEEQAEALADQPEATELTPATATATATAAAAR